MKRLLYVVLPALALLVLGANGCATTSSHSAARHQMTNTVAVALTVNGSEIPTPAQWSAVLAHMEPQLAALGWVLVTDVRRADRLLRIDFTPNPAAPDTSGRAVVLSMLPNPRGPASLAYTRSGSAIYAPSYTTGSYYGAGYGYGYGYDRYDRWSDGSYSYTPPSSAATSPAPASERGFFRGSDSGDRQASLPPPSDRGFFRSSPSYDNSSSYSSSNSAPSYTPPPTAASESSSSAAISFPSSSSSSSPSPSTESFSSPSPAPETTPNQN